MWKSMLLNAPVIGAAARISANLTSRLSFADSASYWETRYAKGGHSGVGSYGRLAQFKASVLNEFVATHDVRNVIELGCGDGEQLRLAQYPAYLGVDVSATAVALCRSKFGQDPTRRFLLKTEFADLSDASRKWELGLSLDVIYHLVEDQTYEQYMRELFACSTRFVGIYASNHNQPSGVAHVRHRRFTDWIERHAATWKLVQRVENPYPYVAGTSDTSFADFFFYSCAASNNA